MGGIDLDIEGGRGDNYPVFLRSYENLWTTIQKETIWLLVRRSSHTLIISLDQKDLDLVIVQCSFLYFESIRLKILNYFGHDNNRMQLYRFEKQ